MKIAMDIYRHANQAGVCYLEIWRLIADAMQALPAPEVPKKWCAWCKNDNHNDDECWSTRPGGWKAYQPTAASVKIPPSALRANGEEEAGSGTGFAFPADVLEKIAMHDEFGVELTRLIVDRAEATGVAPQILIVLLARAIAVILMEIDEDMRQIGREDVDRWLDGTLQYLKDLPKELSQ